MSGTPQGAHYKPVDGEGDAGAISYVRYLVAIFEKLRRYYVLLAVLSVLSLGVGLCTDAFSEPEYTASAILGAAPSPLSDLTSQSGGLSGALGSGLTKKLGLGGHTSGTDLFDQYVELLTSSRVAARLAQDPNVLRAIFYRKYNWQTHAWKLPDDILAVGLNSMKRLFHYPAGIVPGRDDVARYLKRNVTVVAPLTSSFVTVSLDSQSPAKAEWLLNTLLLDADSIIREDKRRDTMARIAYLAEILPTVTQADQRNGLGTILSSEQQTMMVVRADKRYASALVDPPHAPVIPTWPDLLEIVGIAILLAVGIWGVLVAFVTNDRWLLRFSEPQRFAGVSVGRANERMPAKVAPRFDARQSRTSDLEGLKAD
jgi:uncharacterized protein involved in exopolysaccharide biosynthesis